MTINRFLRRLGAALLLTAVAGAGVAAVDTATAPVEAPRL